jgi:hypothetical protein
MVDVASQGYRLPPLVAYKEYGWAFSQMRRNKSATTTSGVTCRHKVCRTDASRAEERNDSDRNSVGSTCVRRWDVMHMIRYMTRQIVFMDTRAKVVSSIMAMSHVGCHGASDGILVFQYERWECETPVRGQTQAHMQNSPNKANSLLARTLPVFHRTRTFTQWWFGRSSALPCACAERGVVATFLYEDVKTAIVGWMDRSIDLLLLVEWYGTAGCNAK